MKKERNRGVYYDSLIRKMSTIIFLIFRFLKKEGKVSVLQLHFSLLLLWNIPTIGYQASFFSPPITSFSFQPSCSILLSRKSLTTASITGTETELPNCL